MPPRPATDADSADALLAPALRADLLADINEVTAPQDLAALVCRALAGANGTDAAWFLARRADGRPVPDVTATAGLDDQRAKFED